MASVSSEATESAAVFLPKDEEVLRMRRAPISAPALSTSDAPPTSSRAMRELSVVTVSDSEEAGGGATKGKERRRIGAARKVEDETAGATTNDTEAPDMLVVYSPAGKTFVALRTIEDDMDADPMDELPAPPLPHIEPGDQRALEDLSAFFPFIFPHDFRAEQLFEEMIYDRRRRVLLLLLPIDLLFIALTRCTGCSVVPWAAMLLFDLFGCVALIRESRLLMSIFVATQCLLATPYIALTNENPALLLFHMVVLLLVVQLRFTMPHSRDQVRAEADDAPEEADEEAARDR